MSQIRKYQKNFKAVLAIDFDRTICMSEWPNLGMQRKEVGKYINLLTKEGFGIVINTCREGVFLADAINWLNHNGINYHYINCNFPHLIEQYGSDCRKISADIYIDDKCLTGLPEWKEIYNIVKDKFP